MMYNLTSNGTYYVLFSTLFKKVQIVLFQQNFIKNVFIPDER